MSNRILALDHLPVELLYDIFTIALSSAFPLTSKRLYAVYKSASTTVHAEYLIGCYEEAAAHSASVRSYGFVSKILRYPVCTRKVLEAVFRSPKCPNEQRLDNTARIRTILPRRLFRSLMPRDDPGQKPWSDEDEPLPLLQFLCDHERVVPRIETDSYDGYALTRAVYAGFTPLIRFLLANKASPECKGHLAVTVAIRRKSLPLVRMLIERDGPYNQPQGDVDAGSRKRRRTGAGDGRKSGGKEDGGSPPNAKGVRKSGVAGGSPSRSAKRRKLGDRVAVNQEMLKTAVKCDARDIVDYFMKEKGCAPDMQTVLMMGR